jgi:hypothetical protein
MRFQLKGKVFAVNLSGSERRTEYIPEGEVVDVVARRDDIGHVEVLWKSTAFFVSVVDLEKLGTAVPK